MLGRAKRPMARCLRMAPLVFEDGLQDAEGPAEALAHEAVHVDGGLGEGERLVLVDDGVALLEEVHGEVGVFGDGVGVVASAGVDG